MRTPFDSAVELDDLLEETRGLCPEVWTGPERCRSRGRTPFRQRIKTSENLVLMRTPADRPADPVPRWPGDPRPGQRSSQRLLDSG